MSGSAVIGNLKRKVTLFDGQGNAFITSTAAGAKHPLDVILYDSSGNPVVVAGALISVPAYGGTPVDEQISVGSGTQSQIPSSLPTVPYRITFSADKTSAAGWLFKFVTGGTFGHQFFVGQTFFIEMAGSKGIFVSHDSGSSQTINVSTQPVS